MAKRTVVRSKIVVDAPAETIWSLYDDLEAFPKWAPNVVAVEVVGGGKKCLGARVRTTMRMGPFKQRMEEEIVRYEPLSASVMRGGMPGWRYDIELSLAEKGPTTELEYACISDYALPIRVFVPLLDRMNKRMLDDALSALKTAAERKGG